MTDIPWKHFPLVAETPTARKWLTIVCNSNHAPNTVEGYGRGLNDFLSFCNSHSLAPENVTREYVLLWVNDLTNRPNKMRKDVDGLGPGSGLSEATIAQKLTSVRLFYDYLLEEGIRTVNPVGRAKRVLMEAIYSKGNRGIMPRSKKLPWIPTEEQWLELLAVVKGESLRTRFMFTLQYDCALRREELCGLDFHDFDSAHQTLKIRSEITKTRRERVVIFSECSRALLNDYLSYLRRMVRRPKRLFLSESRRNYAQPLTIWTWSKIINGIAKRAKVPQFTTHTQRHLRLTDLARAGWDIHEIANFAGHRKTDTTLQYIHLSGRDLKRRYERTAASLHTWREARLKELLLEV